jgi:acetyl-CoA synthetase
VAAADGEPAAPGQVGELVIRQPWPGMAHGFWRDEARYLASYWERFPDVWVHGDWATVDEAGFWYVRGRSDDTIKVAGKRVGPAEYESALVAHPRVVEAAAIGVPDELKGESAVCFVTCRSVVEDNRRFERELQEHVAESLGKPLKPSRVHVVPALPKTKNGKVLRRLVKSAFLGLPPGDVSSLEDPACLASIRACGEAGGSR